MSAGSRKEGERKAKEKVTETWNDICDFCSINYMHHIMFVVVGVLVIFDLLDVVHSIS